MKTAAVVNKVDKKIGDHTVDSPRYTEDIVVIVGKWKQFAKAIEQCYIKHIESGYVSIEAEGEWHKRIRSFILEQQ